MCESCIEDGRVPRWLAEIVAAHEAVYDDGYEGAHIVIGDWNLNNNSICYCLAQPEIPMQPETRRFLHWLLTIPEESRAPQEED